MNILCTSFVQKLFDVMAYCPAGYGLRFFNPIQTIPVSKEIAEEHFAVFSRELQLHETWPGGIPEEQRRDIRKQGLLLWKKEYLWRCTHLPPAKLNEPCVFIEGPSLQYSKSFFQEIGNIEEPRLEIEIFCHKSYNFQKIEKRSAAIPAAEWRERVSALYSTVTCFIDDKDPDSIEGLDVTFKKEGYASTILTRMINECGSFLRTKTWRSDCGFVPSKGIAANVVSYQIV